MALAALSPAPAPPPAAPTPLTPVGASASGGLSFGDVLDTVNPLQHIPLVSSLYRAVTGSTISSTAQIAGDTMYGAVLGGAALAGAALGFASSVANVAVQAQTGKDIAGNVVSSLAPAGAATPLTPFDPATSAAIAAANATGPTAPASGLLHTLFNQTLNPAISNAQYTRAQMFDVGNKLLVKMAV